MQQIDARYVMPTYNIHGSRLKRINFTVDRLLKIRIVMDTFCIFIVVGDAAAVTALAFVFSTVVTADFCLECRVADRLICVRAVAVSSWRPVC